MKRKLLSLLALSACGFGAAGAWADEGVAGAAEERHELMESMSGAIEPMVAMVRGMQPYDADKMRELAEKIASLGGDNLISLFPEGSMSPASDALPAIWEDFERFSTLAHNLVDAAKVLADAADTPPAPPSAAPPDPSAGGSDDAPAMDAGIALVGLGMSCGACHDDFRKEDDH